MKNLLLPYRVVDMRYHTGTNFQVLFATCERWEAFTVAKESGGGATVIYVNEDGFETVLFINLYKINLGLI
ncbi:MAG: hypothetical protein M3405_04615 [Acidobacteriota bacterium]|jgi:hypothetical protein|nr:hypothetical protein [Acidobacteriota bacterium]